ncbi:MAG: oxygenase MpaB family protein [Tsuneonella sp.]
MARAPSPTDLLRERLVSRVRAVFNDTAGGERPVPISDDALFERDTPIRMVHADVVSMMVGGISALLLQMLHPHALQGVLDHSDFRADMHGRLRRTARFIAVTTFGQRDAAAEAIARVNRVHAFVKGTMADGSRYSAQDPATLAWVHVAEAVSFLGAYRRLVRPAMPLDEQDEYYRQFAQIAGRLGAHPVPETSAEAADLLDSYRPQLVGSSGARELASLVLSQRPAGAPGAVQGLLAGEAVALLPSFARTMLGLGRSGLSAAPGRLATQAVGAGLRWAFRQC